MNFGLLAHILAFTTFVVWDIKKPPWLDGRQKKKAKVVASQNDNCPVVKLLFTLHRFDETSKIASSENVIKNVRILSVFTNKQFDKTSSFFKARFWQEENSYLCNCIEVIDVWKILNFSKNLIDIDSMCLIIFKFF